MFLKFIIYYITNNIIKKVMFILKLNYKLLTVGMNFL